MTDRIKFYLTPRCCLSIACLCFFVLMSTQCGRSELPKHTESRIIVSHPGDERIFFQDEYELQATFLMFLPLLRMDLEKGPQPALAERWEHSAAYGTSKR